MVGGMVLVEGPRLGLVNGHLGFAGTKGEVGVFTTIAAIALVEAIDPVEGGPGAADSAT